ncbi:T9SS C-terminal target domain-containing protein, partial [bacterium]
FAVITIPAPPDTTPSGFYDYYWNVFATDGMDTTYALNGQGVFFFEYNAPNLPPGEFTRLIPADSSVDDFNGSCAWSASLDPDGDSITYLFHLDSNYPYFFSPTDSVVSDTTIHVEIEIPVSQLDELYWFNWTVHATDGVDTVEAANGAGVFGVDIILASNEQNSVVNEFGLSIYPNPFNPSTTIQYTLDQTGPVSIAVMDVLGRQVAELVNETMNPGRYALHWTAQGSNGAMLPSGSYWVHLNTPGRQAIHRILLIR